RVAAIPSIDGVSTVDGKPASYQSGGYLVRPKAQIVVPGWRLDDNAVASFEFGVAAKGYARQMGHQVANVGIIAAAFFSEDDLPEVQFSISAGPRTPQLEPRSREKLDEAIDEDTDNVATGFGKRMDHRVHQVEFRRAATTPDAVIRIRYDTMRGLKQRGVACPPPEGWQA
ncbi:MAG: hypothetical protein ABSH20_14925, partial [Tepidisphaeraceae bacterium]